GHQAIVEAEGGKVIGAGEIVHGKTSEIRHEGGALFEGVPSPFAAARYHSLCAERATLPASLRENARSSSGVVMAVEHASRPMFGVQFHPESVATAAGRRILANFVGLCAKRSKVELATLAPAAASEGGFSALLERLLAGGDLGRDEAHTLG